MEETAALPFLIGLAGGAIAAELSLRVCSVLYYKNKEKYNSYGVK